MAVGDTGSRAAAPQPALPGYYVRSGRVKLLHQDTPAVAGKRQHDEYYGKSLSASDWLIAVGIPGESIGSLRDAGMVQVFSHTLTNGRPPAMTAAVLRSLRALKVPRPQVHAEKFSLA